jgi:multicomponent K+:H+ antiporter subunit A
VEGYAQLTIARLVIDPLYLAPNIRPEYAMDGVQTKVDALTLNCISVVNAGQYMVNLPPDWFFPTMCFDTDIHLRVTNAGNTSVQFDNLQPFQNRTVARDVKVIVDGHQNAEMKVSLLEAWDGADTSLLKPAKNAVVLPYEIEPGHPQPESIHEVAAHLPLLPIKTEDYDRFVTVMSRESLILVAPCSLLLGAVLQLVAARLLNARAKGILAFLTSLPAVLAVAAMAGSVRAGQFVECNPLPWDGPLALILHVDALSLLFALMGTLLGAIVLLYSIGYMAQDKSATRFYCAMLIFIGGFVGLVYSANLFLLYLFWEVVGLCSFSLVGFWYTKPDSVRGARKVLLMTHIAGYGLLAAILVIYQRTGSTLWTDPRVAHAFTGWVFVLMLVALMAKSVQFPLHTWIPEAMNAPTPVSALLHSACYVTSGVYLAARMHCFGAWPQAWGQPWGNETLIWIGTVTMAVGVMYAMVQNDLKRMLAFSTVSQIGYMMVGIGIGSPLAIAAGLLHCLNHGFFKGGLFLGAGSVQHASGTRDMNQARRPGPADAAYHALLAHQHRQHDGRSADERLRQQVDALHGGLAGRMDRSRDGGLGGQPGHGLPRRQVHQRGLSGPLTDATQDAHESPPTMLWGMGLLASGSVILGIAPQLAVNCLLNPILSVMKLETVQVTWFGLSGNAGSFSSMGGLVLTLVSLILGGLIYAIAYAGRPAEAAGGAALDGGGIFTGGEPLPEQGRLTASDFSSIFMQNWRGFFHWTNVDRIYLGLSGRLASGFARPRCVSFPGWSGSGSAIGNPAGGRAFWLVRAGLLPESRPGSSLAVCRFQGPFNRRCCSLSPVPWPGWRWRWRLSRTPKAAASRR